MIELFLEYQTMEIIFFSLLDLYLLLLRYPMAHFSLAYEKFQNYKLNPNEKKVNKKQKQH